MIEKQEYIDINSASLVARVTGMREAGYRLIQICCTKLEQFELHYSFGKDLEFKSLRLRVPLDAARILSVSSVYPNAFLYENEIHDLFGVVIEGISVDYKGNFYRTMIKYPFSAPSPAQKEGE